MSWSIGSDAITAGSEVMSDNGNTYTLWYTDGAWSARFEPESMPIAGTGLTAMTREADNDWDVNGDTLDASGMGDVTVDGAMYHVWMQDGALAGARFDKAIHADTDLKIGDIVLPTLSSEDDDTAATELRTKLHVADRAFPFSDLLESGVSSEMGDNIVSKARSEIEKIRGDVSALINLDTAPTGLSGILEARWSGGANPGQQDLWHRRGLGQYRILHWQPGRRRHSQ